MSFSMLRASQAVSQPIAQRQGLDISPVTVAGDFVSPVFSHSSGASSRPSTSDGTVDPILFDDKKTESAEQQQQQLILPSVSDLERGVPASAASPRPQSSPRLSLSEARKQRIKEANRLRAGVPGWTMAAPVAVVFDQESRTSTFEPVALPPASASHSQIWAPWGGREQFEMDNLESTYFHCKRAHSRHCQYRAELHEKLEKARKKHASRSEVHIPTPKPVSKPRSARPQPLPQSDMPRMETRNTRKSDKSDKFAQHIDSLLEAAHTISSVDASALAPAQLLAPAPAPPVNTSPKAHKVVKPKKVIKPKTESPPKPRRAPAPKAPRRVGPPVKDPKLVDYNEHFNYAPPLGSLEGRKMEMPPKYEPGTAIQWVDDPDRHLLHPSERLLAESLNLNYLRYLTLKRRIFKLRLDHYRQGWEFSKAHCQRATTLDVNKLSMIWAAYTSVGWFDEHWVARWKFEDGNLKDQGPAEVWAE